MNVLLPIASHENQADTEYIRSLLEIERKTVLQYVLEAFEHVEDISNFVIIVNRRDVEKYRIDDIIRLLRPDAKIVVSEGNTKGAACSCLLAVDELNMEEPLLIVNGEQLILEPMEKILAFFREQNDDGGIVIFDDIHPRWSFVRVDEDGFVTEAAEKRPISRNATAGLYYFKTAADFIDATMKSIKKDASVNGKYYICPVYNELVLQQKKIGTYRITRNKYINFKYESVQSAQNMLKATGKGVEHHD